MTEEEKAEDTYSLAELFRDLDRLGNKTTEFKEGYAYAFFCLREKLSPRSPKVVEVPWYEAIEGLVSGKYRKVFFDIVQENRGFVWRDGLWCERYGGYHVITDDNLGTWLAELA